MSTVTLDRKQLERALRTATRIIPRRLNIPALGGVRLMVNGAVRLAATDLEYGAVLELARAGGTGDADMLLPAARLLAQVRTGRGETVTLEQDGPNARLDGTAAVVGMDPADFPTLPIGPEGELAAVLDGPELVEAVRSVEFAVSGEIVRYALTGVLLDIEQGKKGGRVSLVSSDGKRLARWRMKAATVRKAAQMIVPTKALAAVTELAARGDRSGLVKVYIQVPKATAPDGEKSDSELPPTRVHFALPGAGVFSRLIEGNFPDHEAVTPFNLPCSWTMDRKELAEAIKAVLPATTEKTRAVRFTLRGPVVELFAKSQDVGEARATVQAHGTADEREVVLDPEYVLDYLAALPKCVDRVKLAMKDKASAVLWSGAARHEYVQMPLTITL